MLLILGLGLTAPGGALSLTDLQKQIDGASPGQTVAIPPGLYRGELVVRRPVVLRAQAGARLVHSPGTPGPTLWIQACDVTVEGLEVEGSGEGTRRDHTAVLVTGCRVTLRDLRIRQAWAGLWLDGCTGVTVEALEVTGLTDFPFWERGDGVRVTQGTDIRLHRLRLRSVADGIFVERSSGVRLDDGAVQDARYGLHVMFCTGGRADRLAASRTVVGVMVMESSRWTIQDSRLTDGYRTGSAGIRAIRTRGVEILRTEVARHASGIALLDVRDGLFQGNQITGNGTAWAWGGDNSGTRVLDNTHRGNLSDFAGEEPAEKSLTAAGAHLHGPAAAPVPTVMPSALPVRPVFDRNYWDGWRGTDLDQDGTGDTPYRFDPPSAVLAASRPWAGVFLGSPWTQWSRTLPGGEVIDGHPRVSGGR